MRLIDADKLIYNDVDCKDGNTYLIVHAPQIDKAPTAYDVKGVVEQLEYAEFETSQEPHAVNLYKAIEIVKGGGIDE